MVGTRAVLRVLPGFAGQDDDLELFVRAARRDMARLLRAMAASGISLSGLSDAMSTRLAHCDAVTAKYLRDAAPDDTDSTEVEGAAQTLRSLERWLVAGLSASEHSRVRVSEIGLRIESADLCGPLMQVEWTERDAEELDREGGQRSIRGGLAALDSSDLARVCSRLGIATGEGDDDRRRAEHAVVRTLLDGQLLAVLIATLPGESLELLATLIRGGLRVSGTHGQVPPAVAVESLRACGLAYGGLASRGPPADELWVPVEIHRRVDGVLRAFGV